MDKATGNQLGYAWRLDSGGSLNTFQLGLNLTFLVPFSRAAQFKHHGGGRRGRTFRQRLVQAQEGLAARASLSCAIRFII